MSASRDDVSLRVVREALIQYRKQTTLRKLARELGIKSATTVSNLVTGLTEKPNQATQRKLRQWYTRSYRKIYDSAGGKTAGAREEHTLLLIQDIVEDFSRAQQKKLACAMYEMLRESYARIGVVPSWMRRLKELIDARWP